MLRGVNHLWNKQSFTHNKYKVIASILIKDNTIKNKWLIAHLHMKKLASFSILLKCSIIWALLED